MFDSRPLRRVSLHVARDVRASARVGLFSYLLIKVIKRSVARTRAADDCRANYGREYMHARFGVLGQHRARERGIRSYQPDKINTRASLMILY